MSDKFFKGKKEKIDVKKRKFLKTGILGLVGVGSVALFSKFAKAGIFFSDGSSQNVGGNGYDVAFNAGFGTDMTGADLIVQTYGELVMTRSGSFTGESGYIDTVATGSAAIVDIEKNGTTIYSVKPQFAASATGLTAGTLKTDGTEDFVANDRITFKVTQIGSSVAGQKLRFTIKGTVT